MSKTVDSFELIGCPLSISELCDLLSSCVSELFSDEEGGPEELPDLVGQIISEYLSIPKNAQHIRVGKELWVRSESADFRRHVAFLQCCYPWATTGFKLDLDNDTYLESLELYTRYRQDYDSDGLCGGIGTSDDDHLSALRIPPKIKGELLSFMKDVCSSIPSHAYKHSKSDLISNYGSYLLQSEWNVRLMDLVSQRIKKSQFESEWEIYGDSVDRLSHGLTADELNDWRDQVIPKVVHLKQTMLKDIQSVLFDASDPTVSVRRIHLTTDICRDRCKHVYDLYISPKACLLQKFHVV